MSSKFQPVSTSTNKINHDLEILRGFAGLFVVFAHTFDPVVRKQFDAGSYPSFMSHLVAPAHFAVLIFFILSGYVIGITNKKPLNKLDIPVYLKKRLVRILPIYLIALTFGLLIDKNSYSAGTIILNYTFLHNAFSEVVWSVNPAWSLNYEMLFYLLFIPISYFRIKPLVAFVLFLVIGFINLYLPYNPIITSYTFGFCFWLAGLMVAQKLSISTHEVKVLPAVIYSWAIGNLMGKINILNPVTLFQHIKPFVDKPNYYWAQHIIGADDLVMMPFAFFIVIFFSGRQFKGSLLFFILVHLIPVLDCYIYFRHWETQDPKVRIDIILIVISILTYLIPYSESVLKRIGTQLGSISYGIYIIHYPIILCFGYFTAKAQSTLAYGLKVSLFFLITFASAWVLEKLLQPRIKSLFFKTERMKLQNIAPQV